MTITRLRVHIAPVGFEVDRVVLPAIEMKADRIWLLVHDDPDDRAKAFEDKIRRRFEESGVAVEEVQTDRKDVFKILRAVKEIIERERQNDIYVNSSSGSKIQVIACMMACMMFDTENNLTSYYAEPEEYPGGGKEQQSTGLKDIIELPRYQIFVPEKELVDALKIVRENGGKISKKEMASIAEKEKIISVNAREENSNQAAFASLDKNIIQPLVDRWHFVEVEKIGRTRWIKLTREGNDAMEFLG